MVTLYDVTPAQELSLLNRKYTVHKAILNIATSFTVEDGLDVKVLREAVRLCVLRWDSFGIRFVRSDGRIRQHFGPRECLYIRRRSFASHALMDEYFHHLAGKPLPLIDSPLAGFVVFTTPEGDVGLFSVVSHLIMDTWAIVMFSRDVLAVAWALSHGEPLPPEPGRYEQVLVTELAYQQSERCARDRQFWEAELGESQPLFTSIRGSAVLEHYRRRIRNPQARQCWTQYLRTRADHVVRTVSRQDVERFQQFADANGLPSLHSMFLLALRMHMAAVNDRTDDVMIGVNVARRASREEKTSGGSRAQHLRFRTILPPETTFLAALRVIVEKQRTYYRHVDFSSVETQFMPHRFFASRGSRPGTNYYDTHVSFQPIPLAAPHDLRVSTRWYCCGAASFPCYLVITDDDSSGALRCYWERNIRHVPVEAIDQCQDFMVRTLRAGVERPSITLAELMDLS